MIQPLTAFRSPCTYQGVTISELCNSIPVEHTIFMLWRYCRPTATCMHCRGVSKDHAPVSSKYILVDSDPQLDYYGYILLNSRVPSTLTPYLGAPGAPLHQVTYVYFCDSILTSRRSRAWHAGGQQPCIKYKKVILITYL